MRSSLRSPRMWIGIVVSVVAMALAVRGVSWREVGGELGQASYAWLLPTVAVITLGQVARAARWQALFGTGPRPVMYSAFAILSVGYLVNTVLPLRLGDFVRAWLVGATTPANSAEALATIVIERVVDLLTIAALVALLVPAPTAALFGRLLGPGPWADAAVVQASVLTLAVGSYVTLIALAFLADPLRSLIAASLARLGVRRDRAVRVGDVVGRFLAALGALRRPRTAFLVLAWSVAIWLLGGLQYWTVMQMFHMGAPFVVAMFVLGATAIAAILPSSPGYVGVFHASVREAMPAVVPQASIEQIVSYALVLHAVTFVTLVGLGIVGLLMLGMSFSELVRGPGVGRAPADV